MKFLNGFKTAIGIIGAIATPVIALGGNVGQVVQDGVSALPHLYATVEGGFLMLTALGIIHKAEKRKSGKQL